MRKISKFAALMLMLLALVVAAAACEDKTPESIAVSETYKPRAEFVLGQELDFSNGMLMVKYKNSVDEVDLSSNEVDISGYDKDTLGKQTLTISYKGVSTTFQVEVVNRIRFENVETKYFVGESFDKSKGQIKVTYDNGTVDPKLMSLATVTDFDSSAPATDKEVTVRYGDYTDTLKVNIYAIDSISLKNFTKTNYKSHEETFATPGSYLEVTGGSGALTKHITLTDSMVQGTDGYHPERATYNDNRTDATALSQTVKIKYASGETSVNIKIVYSAVSIIRQRARELVLPKWINGIPEVDEDDSIIALEAMSLYFKLSSVDKPLITTAEKNILVPYAALYGYDKWLEAAEEFNDIFEISDSGLSLMGENITAIKSKYELLRNPSEPFLVLAEVLQPLYNEFNSMVLFKSGTLDVTVSRHLSKLRNIDPAVLKNIPDMLDFSFRLYDYLKDIPSDWTNAILKETANAAKISQAYSEIIISPFRAERSLFSLVSKWRELNNQGKNDFFDIIYSHYLYNVGPANSNNTYIRDLQNIYLPGKLEELFNNYSSAINNMFLLRNLQNNVVDATMLMLGFNNTERIREEINSNPMYILLYNSILKFDGFGVSGGASFTTLRSSLIQQEKGYFDVCGAMLSDEIFNDFFNDYLNVYKQYIAGEDYGTDLEALLYDYLNMSPTWQFGFNIALNPHYESTLGSGYNNLNLKYPINILAALIKEHYLGKLGGDDTVVFAMLEDLLNAVEYYSLYQYTIDESALRGTDYSFLASMKKVVDRAESTMRQEDRDLFEANLRGYYNIYKKIYDKYTVSNYTAPTLNTEWSKVFTEINNVLSTCSSLSGMIDNGRPEIVAVFLSSYAYVESLVYQILNSPKNAENDVARWAFYHERLFNLENDDPITIDAFVFFCKYAFSVNLKKYSRPMLDPNSKTTAYIHWSSWTPSFKTFFEDAFYVINRSDIFKEASSYDAEKIFKSVNSFKRLTLEQQYVFYSIDSVWDKDGKNIALNYHNALLKCFDKIFPTTGTTSTDLSKKLNATGRALQNFQLGALVFLNSYTAQQQLAADQAKDLYVTLENAVRALLGLGATDAITQSDIDEGISLSENHKELLEWYEYCAYIYNRLDFPEVEE